MKYPDNFDDNIYMLLDKIAHYPASLTAPVRTILESARQQKTAVIPAGHFLSGFPETVRFSRKDIPDQRPVWVNAVLGPCVFVALVTKDGQGEVQDVRAGHFSTNFSDPEMDQFLAPDGPTDLSSVWLTGLSQKSGPESLKATTDRLVARVNATGLPLSLEWSSPERPEVKDLRSQQIISDLGFGLLDSPGPTREIRRIVSLGITRSWALLSSRLLGRVDDEAALPLNVSVFTSDRGRLSQQFNYF